MTTRLDGGREQQIQLLIKLSLTALLTGSLTDKDKFDFPINHTVQAVLSALSIQNSCLLEGLTVLLTGSRALNIDTMFNKLCSRILQYRLFSGLDSIVELESSDCISDSIVKLQ